ncbi:hypothetical protein [Streptomyces sp. NPDC001296]
MNKTTPFHHHLVRAGLFSLVRGACWAAGSACVAGIVWWVQHR